MLGSSLIDLVKRPAIASIGGRRLLSGLLVACVGLVLVGAAPAAPAAADIVTQIKASQVQFDLLNRQAEAAAERYNAGRLMLALATQRATAAQQAVTRDDGAVTALRYRLGAFAAEAYKAGTGGMALHLMSGGRPGLLLDQLGTLDHISRSQSDLLATLATARHRQAASSHDAQAALADARATLNGLARDKAAVALAAGRAQQVLADLQAKQQQLIQAARDAASRQAAQAQAAALAAQAQAAAAAAAAFAAQPVTAERPVAAAHQRHYSGDAAQIALQSAKDQLGKPYQYGAAGPDSFDCSGLTMYAYAQAGISLPHHAADQYNQGRHVPESDLQPGDLVFFDNLGHEGIYAGNGQFIHAPHSGTVVQYASMSGYWQQNYVGAVRLVG